MSNKSVARKKKQEESDNETSYTEDNTDIFDSEKYDKTDASEDTDTDEEETEEEVKIEEPEFAMPKTTKTKKEVKIYKRDPEDEKKFLKELCIDNNIKMAAKTVDDLVSLKYPNGEFIFNGDAEISMNIISMFAKDGKKDQEIFDFIRSCKNRKEILFNQISMLESQIEFEFEIAAFELLKDNAVERKDIQCSKCGQNKIEIRKVQLRRADEGTTILYHCVNCGNRWTRS